jgi:hypothetical protein
LKNYRGWLRANPSFATVPYVENCLPAEATDFDEDVEIEFTQAFDRTTAAGRTAAYFALCETSISELKRFEAFMKKCNATARRSNPQAFEKPLPDLLLAINPLELWREFTEGLLAKRSAATRGYERLAAERDLAMFPLQMITAVRPEHLCSAQLGITIGRLPDNRYWLKFPEPDFKNRKGKMVVGGLDIVFEPVDEKHPGWDHNHYLRHYEDFVRPELLKRLGLESSPDFFLPATGSGTEDGSHAITRSKMSSRFAEVAVQILGPRAAVLTAGKCRHVFAGALEFTGCAADVPVGLRNNPRTAAPRYLGPAEPIRQARTQRQVAAQLNAAIKVTATGKQTC